MAERAAHSDEGYNVDDDESNDLIRHNNNNNNNNNNKGHDSDEFKQIVPSDGSSNANVARATYIVQIPRDQIYRVPPPENAEIVERYRNPVQNGQSGGRRRRCAYWFLSVVFVIAFVASVIVCVHKFTLSPKPPSFSVKHLLLKRSSSSKKLASPGFQVSVETSNPNNVNDVGYKQGSVSLSYKGKQIGKGNLPELDNLAPGKSDPVDIDLSGTSKGGLPKDFDKSASRKKSGDKTLNMELSMNIPVHMKTWLWTNTLDLDVVCDFEAESMGDHFQIQSQKCDVHK